MGRCTGTPHSCDSDHYFGNQFECIRHGCFYLDYGEFGLGGCSGIPTSCSRLGEMGESCEWHGCYTVGLNGFGDQDHGYDETNDGGSNSVSASNMAAVTFYATIIVASLYVLQIFCAPDFPH